MGFEAKTRRYSAVPHTLLKEYFTVREVSMDGTVDSTIGIYKTQKEAETHACEFQQMQKNHLEGLLEMTQNTLSVLHSMDLREPLLKEVEDIKERLEWAAS